MLTVFTPDRGKLELIGKGIRKTTSRKAGHLELFTHVSFLAAQARTWDIITEAQAIQSFRHLRTDLDTIGQASYVAELIDAFTQSEDENKLLWDLLLLVLRELDEGVEAGSDGDLGALRDALISQLQAEGYNTRSAKAQATIDEILAKWKGIEDKFGGGYSNAVGNWTGAAQGVRHLVEPKTKGTVINKYYK